MANPPTSDTDTDTAPPTEAQESEAPPHHVNSVDATTGQPMVERVMQRKAELEALLGGLAKDDTGTRNDIEAALAALVQLTSGDLENVPTMVTVDMNRWLERTKHLGERAT